MNKKRILAGFILLGVWALFLMLDGSVSLFAQTKPSKVFSWKFQSAWPPPEKVMGHWGGYGQVAEIGRRVKERTHGGLEIKPFPPNALFKVLEAPDAVRKGAIEMICSSGPYHIIGFCINNGKIYLDQGKSDA